MGRRELVEVRDRARTALAVLLTARQQLDAARGAARQAADRRVDGEVAVRLAELPVERLRDVASAAGLRLGALEAAGVRTVADVLARTPTQLDQLAGVGPTTAVAARAAAEALAATVRAQVGVLPDPGDPHPDDAELLRALHRLASELADRRGTVEPGRAMESALAAPVQVLEEQTGAVRWLFSGGARKARARAAADEVAALLAESGAVDTLARLEAAVAASRAYQPPPEPDLWVDYQRRGAEYATVLEQVAAGAARPAGARLQGGVAADIARAVEAVPLDLRHLRATLRGYQHFGTQYVVHQGRAILGDEMGLGKTIQALAVMAHLQASLGARHFLVVAPASTLPNWLREIGERTDLPGHLLHGDDRDHATAAWGGGGGVGVTSYATLAALPLGDHPAPALVVVDEAHFVKNPEAGRTRAVAGLLERAPRALLMSGTPMENRVEEFRALVALLAPSRPLAVDAATLAAVEGDPDRFREHLSPVYLRRNQEDVLTELPERIDLEEWLEPTVRDAEAYRASVGQGDLMAMRRTATLGFGHGDPSAKLERLAELLEEYEIEGRKVVVFSYFRAVLDAVAAAAGGCPQLHGDVPPAARQALIDEFGQQPGFAVLAAQVEAGGVGVNLQAASVVVLMEPQLKPSTEHQAVARAHRMGQTRRVVVHRLLARGTVDEALVQLLAGKQGLFDAYARPSAVKDASAAAVDAAAPGPAAEVEAEAVVTEADEAALVSRLVQGEQARLGLAG